MLAAQHPEVVRAVVVGDAPLSRNQHATEEPDHRAQNVLWHRLAGRPANEIEPTLREMPIRLTVLQYSKWPISSEKATLYECAVHRDAGVLARRAVRRVECRRQAGARRRRRVVLELREAVAHAVACQCRVVGLDVQSILRVEAVASEEAVDGGAVVVVLVLGWLMRLGLNQQGAGEANLVLVLGNQRQESGEVGLFLRQVGVQQGLIAFGPHDVDARHSLAHRALRPDGSKHLRRDVGVRAPHRAVVLSPRALHRAWRPDRALRRRREGGRTVGPQDRRSTRAAGRPRAGHHPERVRPRLREVVRVDARRPHRVVGRPSHILARVTTGFLALVGGDEFKRGNEAHDRLLVEHRGAGPAYVVPTAAARQRPDLAVATAQQWFKSLGLDIAELRVLKRWDASSATNVELAERGGLFYLTGGDPGLVVDVLRSSPVWRAIAAAWLHGAALAGSSAGAMALAEWTLVRRAYPGHAERRSKPALGLVPRVAVAPHFNTFGHRWVDSVLAEPLAEDVLIVGIDERSAALWDGHAWTARGRGRITVVTRRDRAVSQPGAPVQLPAPRAGPDG